MARVRSPSYPSYSLEDAIQNARKVFDADRRNPVAREVAAKHLGYSSLNGAADKALATMIQYGLFEKVAKGEVRVSQTAVDILYPDYPDQKGKALHESAFSPPLFKTLHSRFSDSVPSNDALRAYLLRENFNDRAVGPIITAYSKTCALLEQENAAESVGNSIHDAEESDLSNENVSSDSDSGHTFGGVKVGDHIQWLSQDTFQFKHPKRVRMVSEDNQWVAVEGSETGIPMSEVIVESIATKTSTASPKFPISSPKGTSTTSENRTKTDTFTTIHGDITLAWPATLSSHSLQDLEDWMQLMLRKIKREVEHRESLVTLAE